MIYFCIYTYVVVQSLVPLPDQPPRIEFLGVTCVAGGLVLAIASLIGRHRGFYWLGLCFFPLAALQMIEKIKFLEMMLEPFTIERITRYSLGLILLLWLSPPVNRLFDQKPKNRQRRAMLPQGVQF